MSTAPVAPDPTAAEQVSYIESAEERTHRLSVGVLIGVVGIGLLALLTQTTGIARFALSDAFDAVPLPTPALPAFPVVLVCGLACVAAAVVLFLGVRRGWLFPVAGTVAGIAVTLGFLTWGAGGRDLPFPVANQLSGTLALATPLVFGALCGVLCERAGVVNVAIEGQFLTAAFAAAVVGTATRSVGWALLAAIVAGVAMAALLAVFSITYLVNQVVLGVVLNLLASGLTGYLFDQMTASSSGFANGAPLLQPIRLGPLADIPFLGPVLFSQTLLAYLAIVSVIVVWVLLFRTRWGLRVRSVGEHPKAADTVGISVAAIRWSSVLAGGVFAGLGGAFFTLASTGSFTKDFTVGNGFIALAAVIMGRWHPVYATIMALFFGFVTQMASQMQTLSTPAPSQFLLMLPYVATIVAVAGLIGRVRAPAADGEPYEKGD